ncbi:DUF935 domain-containing protein [Niveispirillum sp. KHB5.9]|uniref:DUF935 domain-containing protein n=1 Tax=Niveispirillum sp. KHB5.9 TaxID=3400269 RepID=UPI003A897D84
MITPDLAEIAGIAGGRDVTRGYIPAQSLDPQDRVLLAKGGDYLTYEWVMQDDQVKSCFQQRRLAVIAKEWEVLPGGTRAIDKKAADSLRAQIAALEWDRITDKMAYGLFYGFAVGEVMWKRDGAEIVMDDILVRKQRRFRFDDQKRLRLRLPSAPYDGDLVPERKFWTYAAGADNDDDPYGLGLAHWLYWPVFFKRNGIQFWLRLLEKFGAPTVKGEYPAGTSKEDQATLLRAAQAVASSTAVVVQQGSTLSLLEATRSGAVDNATLHQAMDKAIAKIILSQTMTTDDGASLSQAQVHAGVKDTVTDADSDMLCGSFNRGPAVWLTEWNYPGAKPPKLWRTQEGPDLKALAERDEAICKLGYEPTEKHIRDTYGDGWVRRAKPPAQEPAALPPPGAKPPADFAEGEPDAVAELAEQLAGLADAKVADLVGKVRLALDKVERVEDLPGVLLAMYPDLDVSDLAQLLGDALITAELTGRAEVAGDVGF